MIVLALYEGINEIGLASLVKLWSHMKNINVVPVVFNKPKGFKKSKSSRNGKARPRFNSTSSTKSSRSNGSSQDREARTLRISNEFSINTETNAKIFARSFQSFATVDLIVRNVEAYIVLPG